MPTKENPPPNSVFAAKQESSSLSRAERSELAESEGIIERGFNTFLDVGAALLRIKDRRLYRETHSSFEAYCRERFEMTRVHAYRQISAAQVCALLPTPRPANEAQLRPLTTVPRDKAPAVWLQIVKAAGGKHITGRAVQLAVDAWKHGCEHELSYPALAYWQELCLTNLREMRKQILGERPEEVMKELEKIKLVVEQIALGSNRGPDDESDS